MLQYGIGYKNSIQNRSIRSLLKWMDDKNYKASKHEKFRRILKFYYKVVYGNNEHYPEAVSWFSVNVGKEKHGKETNFDMAEYLEEEEIQKLTLTQYQNLYYNNNEYLEEIPKKMQDPLIKSGSVILALLVLSFIAAGYLYYHYTYNYFIALTKFSKLVFG